MRDRHRDREVGWGSPSKGVNAGLVEAEVLEGGVSETGLGLDHGPPGRGRHDRISGCPGCPGRSWTWFPRDPWWITRDPDVTKLGCSCQAALRYSSYNVGGKERVTVMW